MCARVCKERAKRSIPRSSRKQRRVRKRERNTTSRRRREKSINQNKSPNALGSARFSPSVRVRKPKNNHTQLEAVSVCVCVCVRLFGCVFFFPFGLFCSLSHRLVRLCCCFQTPGRAVCVCCMLPFPGNCSACYALCFTFLPAAFLSRSATETGPATCLGVCVSRAHCVSSLSPHLPVSISEVHLVEFSFSAVDSQQQHRAHGQASARGQKAFQAPSSVITTKTSATCLPVSYC